MILLSALIIVIYSVLILSFFFGFKKVAVYSPDKDFLPKIRFSIVIPFRNEAEQLPDLLKSVKELNYPKDLFEIILINDDSSDNFMEIITHFQKDLPIVLTRNKRKSDSPKKDAIETAVKISKHEWIVTTDADCIVPENWLVNFDNFIRRKSPEMIVAPVAYTINNTFLQHFQNLDFLSLQGSSIGAFGIKRPFMCNGANLCYRKRTFFEVNAYQGNDQIAGGDDIFLMEKILKKYPGKVKYLKNFDATVFTKPQPDFKSLKEQRIRWAAKTSAYTNDFGKITGLIVFTTNFYLLLLFILAGFHQIGWQHFGIIFLIKFNVDFALLYRTALFSRQTESLGKYMISSMLYPPFTVFIALFSFFKEFEWKGRSFKK